LRKREKTEFYQIYNEYGKDILNIGHQSCYLSISSSSSFVSDDVIDKSDLSRYHSVNTWVRLFG